MFAQPLIREFCFPDDYAAALELWCVSDGVHVGPSDTAEEIRKKLERDPDLFLVAEINPAVGGVPAAADGGGSSAAIIGTIIGGYDGRRGLIYHLAVHPSFRKRGIGAALLQEVEARLKAKGCYKCYLLILAENTEAVPFYERRGWGEMEEVRLFGKKL